MIKTYTEITLHTANGEVATYKFPTPITAMSGDTIDLHIVLGDKPKLTRSSVDQWIPHKLRKR